MLLKLLLLSLLLSP